MFEVVVLVVFVLLLLLLSTAFFIFFENLWVAEKEEREDWLLPRKEKVPWFFLLFLLWSWSPSSTLLFPLIRSPLSSSSSLVLSFFSYFLSLIFLFSCPLPPFLRKESERKDLQ